MNGLNDDLDELAAHLRDAGDVAPVSCANCGDPVVAVQCDSCREWQCADCWRYGRHDARLCVSCAAANSAISGREASGMAGEDMALAFPGLHDHKLTDQIVWRFYKHWGQGYLAGEGITDLHGDHSGGLKMIHGLPMTNAPCVAQARIYESAKGYLSAVYSYPNGIGVEDHYFWEIYSPGSDLLSDVERFSTEDEMEQRVIELLSEEGERHGG